jgi:hypothetical protein
VGDSGIALALRIVRMRTAEGKCMTRTERTKTTLGDLIVALTDATVQYAKDENEASILVAYLLSDLLQKSQHAVVTPH